MKLIMSLITACGAYLVAEDPHQYNEAPLAFVARQFNQLCTKSRWRALDRLEADEFKVLRGELKLRVLLEEPGAAEVLEDCP